jgi:hypothetical protein
MKAAQLDGLNPFYNSKYSTLASIIESSRQALAANSLAIVQGVSTEYEPLRVKITTMLIHSSDQWLRETLTIRPAKVGIHELASAITYARRIALGSLLAIYADDDDGNLATDEETPGESQSPKPDYPANLNLLKKPESKNETVISKVQTKDSEKNQKENGSGKPPRISYRAQKIREIFSLSGKLGQTPNEMKERIGKIIGLDKSISDSSQINDEEFDEIIESFKKELAEKNNINSREVA